ncbi:MCE family protein [Mycolicibacter algericus]|uniref:Mammalian cell entry protein n=1 Tax=Mycolicibacter algericus DSM 45454 TaxID=723879 RepID=A0ABX3RFD3_MYCAL|nr:MCE family protein [Mycolicibacter algericus]OQZ92581.1 mammalian cell entry protein [Mycolicibacter algericus DSM 45454]
MKPLDQRNPVAVGALGLALTVGIVGAAVEYDKLPFVSSGTTYQAYFADSGGLAPFAAVQVSGFRVGQVSGIGLDGQRVVVTFHIDNDVRIGDRSEAAIKTKSLLGTKVLEITPRGDGEQSGPIPLERTTSPYQLPDALGDLTATISGLDTDQISESLAALADTFRNTPEDLAGAVQGLSRFSQSVNARDRELRQLTVNAQKATAVLARRSDQVVALIADANALLVQLQSQSTALDQLTGHISELSRELSGLVDDNRTVLKSALDKLNDVLTIVDNRKNQVTQSIRLLGDYAMSFGESLSSGPFFKAYVSNLLPGQFLQPFVSAAFSDLGLDPNVLLPSERTDPQTGQLGTPPLPVPYPRTGQGGEPRQTLPETITGNPGDRPCPLPGPGCYPYREPPPAPPPGGPPPGPPAAEPHRRQSSPERPEEVLVPAPNKVPATDAPTLNQPGGTPH